MRVVASCAILIVLRNTQESPPSSGLFCIFKKEGKMTYKPMFSSYELRKISRILDKKVTNKDDIYWLIESYAVCEYNMLDYFGDKMPPVEYRNRKKDLDFLWNMQRKISKINGGL